MLMHEKLCVIPIVEIQMHFTNIYKNELKTCVEGAQWLSGRVIDSKQGLQVRASSASLRCVLEQVTLILVFVLKNVVNLTAAIFIRST